MISGKATAMLAAVPLLRPAVRQFRYSLKWCRWRLARPGYPAESAINLHLGCGDIDYPGFVNIDARPQPHVHHVQRIDALPNFADNSVGLIYGSHCLEHLSHRHLPAVLREWYRVLRPGGILRLSVPDFDQMVKIYLENDREILSVLQPLMGAQDYDFNFHLNCFNDRHLSRALSEAGFSSVRRWHFGADRMSSLPDWSGRHVTYAGTEYPISLNVEAVK